MDESTPSLFSSQQEFVRKHGLQLPLNIAQILGWIVFLIEVCITFLVLLPPLTIPLKVL